MDGDSASITKVCKKLSRDFGLDLGSVHRLGRTVARLEELEWSLARAEEMDGHRTARPPQRDRKPVL
ncbi:MAG TPA: hypothetical protein VFL57_18660 [Bryobacteraceae bacterium]|nr:hypothetical protein [Bryobacteraceae bacterium]